jgi:hypothetical protein
VGAASSAGPAGGAGLAGGVDRTGWLGWLAGWAGWPAGWPAGWLAGWLVAAGARLLQRRTPSRLGYTCWLQRAHCATTPPPPLFPALAGLLLYKAGPRHPAALPRYAVQLPPPSAPPRPSASPAPQGGGGGLQPHPQAPPAGHPAGRLHRAGPRGDAAQPAVCLQALQQHPHRGAGLAAGRVCCQGRGHRSRHDQRGAPAGGARRLLRGDGSAGCAGWRAAARQAPACSGRQLGLQCTS